MAKLSTTERELTRPVDLTRDGKSLNRDAVGFSRQPVHRCAIRGARLRTKRWDYWCVTCERGALCLTIADLGYFGLAEASFVELRDPMRIAAAPWVVPFAFGFAQPDTVSGADIVVRAPHATYAIRERRGASPSTQLDIRALTPSGHLDADIMIDRAPVEESLNVVIPWSDSRFQFTSKHVGLRAKGRIRVFGEELRLETAFATMDFGRGIWPTDTVWNWGAGSGYATVAKRKRRIGLQLGGKWTDGTGLTENGIFLDGKLHKIGATLDWQYDTTDFMKPWRICDKEGAIDLRFEPTRLRPSKVELGLLHSRLHVCFGHWFGTLYIDGERVDIDNLLGWAEEHDARW